MNLINFSITLFFSLPKLIVQMNSFLIWQAPIVFFQKWCLSLLSIVMIKRQVRVLRLMKMHGCLNAPPCIISTPCVIWLRYGTNGIFGLRAFRKYILLCVSNVHNKEYAPLKQNRCIFLYILVWNNFSDLYVICGHISLRSPTARKFILTKIFMNSICLFQTILHNKTVGLNLQLANHLKVHIILTTIYSFPSLLLTKKKKY